MKGRIGRKSKSMIRKSKSMILSSEKEDPFDQEGGKTGTRCKSTQSASFVPFAEHAVGYRKSSRSRKRYLAQYLIRVGPDFEGTRGGVSQFLLSANKRHVASQTRNHRVPGRPNSSARRAFAPWSSGRKNGDEGGGERGRRKAGQEREGREEEEGREEDEEGCEGNREGAEEEEEEKKEDEERRRRRKRGRDYWRGPTRGPRGRYDMT